MKRIGFLISEKENENRRAIVLDDLKKIEKENRKYLFFQRNYGLNIGFSDNDLIQYGFNVVDKNEILKCDIICEPKIGDSNDLKFLKDKIIFGWVHATQNKEITDICVKNKLTVYAWEKMFDGNKHVFYKNNQIAGQAAVLHAMICSGKSFKGCNAAVLGNGNTALGAIEILNSIGATVEVFNRKCEKNFIKEMYKYDIIVNCVLWDVMRKDHIIYKNDLLKLKKNSIIIDVSCDHNGAIESSKPTTIENPYYYVDGIFHYAVDHTPTLLYKDATISLSKEVINYINLFLEEKENIILEKAKIIECGKIIDKEILEYQNILQEEDIK